MTATQPAETYVVTVNADDLRTVLAQRSLHAHQDHGIWDDGNGEKSGTACRECAARDSLIAALDLAEPIERPTPPDDTEGLRERIAKVLKSFEPFDLALADKILAVLVEPPGDLREQMAEAMRGHFLAEKTDSWSDGLSDGLTYCVCGETVASWHLHRAQVAASVRWEDAARRIAAAEARADHAEGELSARDAHTARWEKAERERDEAQRQAQGYRGMKDVYLRERNAAHAELIKAEEIIDRLCDDREAGREVVKAAITEQRQRAEAAEAERDRLEAQVAALQRELAETYAELNEALNHNDDNCEVVAERDALKAAIAPVRERLDWLIANGFGARTDTLVDLRAALDTPSAPESPREDPIEAIAKAGPAIWAAKHRPAPESPESEEG